MEKKTIVVPEEQMQLQRDYMQKVKEIVLQKHPAPRAMVHSFGCQQNVADGQRIKGMLSQMGYEMTDSVDDADFVLYNTCAVRGHAEDRVFGNVGALKHYKARRRDAVVALCGCMMQQDHIAERIRKTYPHVDLLFGTHVLHMLPELLYKVFTEDKRVFEKPDIDGVIAEGMPVVQDGGVRGFLPIMYGCNNFCTYCIVPYVRGRERSREPEAILADAKQMIADGIKEITLLGQNVNSYNGGITFAQLLERINDLEGDFVIRFMTSHPKDCTDELLQTMARCPKVEKHLHLPVQSGNDRVLKAMNRHYTREKYMSLIHRARELMPEISFTSDIIVGFPGETYEEFLDTVSLIKEVRYTALFTFIYSAREGTPAAKLPDPISRKDKGEWLTHLCNVQEQIATKLGAAHNGRVYRVLCEEHSRTEGEMSGHTLGGQIVEFAGDGSMIGKFFDVEITEGKTWILKGKIIDN